MLASPAKSTVAFSMLASMSRLGPQDEVAHLDFPPLLGGVLCLDFANTACPPYEFGRRASGLHEGEHEREHLVSYRHLVAWAVHAGAIPSAEAQLLLARAQEDATGATRALHRALGAREIIRQIFAAIAHRAPLPERALDSLSAALAEAFRHARLIELAPEVPGHFVPGKCPGGGFIWSWPPIDPRVRGEGVTLRLEAPLWPVLRSAADLLTAVPEVPGHFVPGKCPGIDRIKECPYPHCGRLFLDQSKNKSRRWCEMSMCGNRTKARRHYRRGKEIGG